MLTTLATALPKALVATLPATPALHLMRRLASRTQRPGLDDVQRLAMTQARRLLHGPAGHHVAWQWGTQGPLVLLLHGWNGRAAQLAPLAWQLSQQGFRCVAPDITGHGDSVGERTAWRCFIDEPAELATTLGEPLHACIGHSAGGLAMMAARRIHRLQARRFVCVCAPSHPFPPIRAIRQRLNPRPTLIERYQAFIAGQFGTDWPRLEAGEAFAGAAQELMLFYDPKDRFVDHSEGDRILAWCTGATLVKSSGHGHARVLSSDELARAVGAFIALR
jgi:pimeloyl-ACP methyl ester carboxylesterase